MAPFSNEVWICILLAYIGVNAVLYFVARFSPYELHLNKDGSEKKMENSFNIQNTLWFCLAACMQQGVDFAPKSDKKLIIHYF